MKNKYIKKWSNKYIKNDLSSLLIYFDYFSPGISLPKFMKKYTILRYSFYKIFRFLIIGIFFTKLYHFLYEMIELDDDFIIKVQWEWNWSNTITLIEKDEAKVIYKKVYSQEIYQKEKLFYNTYKLNWSKNICLPQMIFLDNNVIQIEFIQLKTFEKLINEGYFSFKESVKKFFVLQKELELFYQNKSLIHWDMWDPNIFLSKSWKTYLIDFSDNFHFTYKYDLYVLYKKIYFAYNKLLLTQKVIDSVFEKDFLLTLWILKEELKKIENKYFENVSKKHFH